MTGIQLLLVHGSCHGAWCWDRLIPELNARGIEAEALDLPGHGQDRTPPDQVTLDSYATAVRTKLRDMGGKAALLGHSAGGYAISAAAMDDPGSVGKLIFLCAYLPVSGQSLSEMRKVWHEQPLVPAIRRSEDGHSFTFAPERVAELFYHDCPADLIAFAESRLSPQPMAPQITPLELRPAFEAVEKHYIICSNDRAIPPDYQRVMAKLLPDDRVSELAASHSPFFSMPSALAVRIAGILHP